MKKKKKVLLASVISGAIALIGTGIFFLARNTGKNEEEPVTTTNDVAETTPDLSNDVGQYRIYEMAVASGFTDTYEAWLNSIKGDTIELAVQNDYIQWKYTEDDDTTWKNLIALNDLKGESGTGISSVMKTDTEGLKDTYTISFTDGTTTTFIVTNGKDGKDGSNGKSAYELYVESHPDYTKSEEEWLDDLVNDRLSEREKVTVTFMVDGDVYDTEIVTRGSHIVEPSGVSKKGYEITGWYIDDTKWFFEGDSVGYDIELTAHFERSSYVINLDSDGGTLTEYGVDALYGDVCELPIPEKDNYVFTGWVYDDENFDTTITYDYDEDITLKASYAPASDVFTYVNTGSGIQLNAYKSSLYSSLHIPSLIEGEPVVILNSGFCSGRPYLTKVTIPDTVEVIKEAAFSSNANLTSVSLGKGVKIMDNLLFHACSSLTSINIPEGVETMGYMVFSECKALTSVTIPNSVTSMGNHMFSQCTNLTDVTIGSGITVIPTYTFDRCTSLSSVTIGESVTEIAGFAFYYCDSLKSLYIPKNLTKMDTYAISYCKNLSSIKVAYNNPVFDSRNYCNAIIETATNTLFRGCKDTVIPSTVTKIGAYAFYSTTGLTDVEIPSNVTSIDKYAFTCCSDITELVIPDTVTSLSQYALSGMGSLETLTIPFVGGSATENTYIGYVFGAEANVNNGTYVPKSLKTVILSDKCISLSEGAFYGCSKIESVIISDSVTSIGNYAFGDCSGLKSINIPKSVTSYGECPFYQCNALEVMTVSNVGFSTSCNQILYEMFSTSGNAPESLKKIIVADDCTSLGTWAFYGLSNVTEIILPDSLTSLGDGAFVSCTGLTSITIPSKITSIGDNTFAGCINLTSANIPDGVTFIGYYAFGDCTGLTSLSIPDSVKEISSGAFYGCTNLTYATYDDAMYLGNENNPYMYLNHVADTSITSCEIHSDCKFIAASSFKDCTNLTSISLPSGIISLGETPFAGCTNLTYASYNGGMYLGNEDNPYMYLSHISDKTVTSFEIHSNCKFIGSHAFESATKLTTLSIPEGVVRIDDRAFTGCTALESITLPSTVTYIGIDALNSCTALTSVTLPSKLEVLEQGAFGRCTALSSVSLPNTVKYIACGSFESCTALSSITYKGTKEDWNDVFVSYFFTNKATMSIACTNGTVSYTY